MPLYLSLVRCLLALGCLMLAAASNAAVVTVAGVTFDTDNATTTATLITDGYDTDFGKALPSDTSADWDVGTSLGSLFQRPTFQNGYSATEAVFGKAGTAVTLGQDQGYPSSGNDREIIQLTWGDGFGLVDGSGDDLAIFEQATSEAFALRVHQASGTPGWSDWFYVPYEKSAYDQDRDATPTRVDFAMDLGLAGITINAVRIASLSPEDTVADQIQGAPAGLGSGVVTFNGDTGIKPARWSSSADAWVGFEATKFDPDIQYVVGLHKLVPGDFGDISSTDTAAGGSVTNLPVVGVGPLLLIGLGALGMARSLGQRARAQGGLAG